MPVPCLKSGCMLKMMLSFDVLSLRRFIGLWGQLMIFCFRSLFLFINHRWGLDMRKTVFILGCCLVGGAVDSKIISSQRTVSFRAAGIYDAAGQQNAVDKSAQFDSARSSGVGRNEDLVVGVQDFSPLLERAFGAGYGGVVYFDGAEIGSDSATTAFNISFGSKRIRVDSGSPLFTDAFNLDCTPISGETSGSSRSFLGVDGVIYFDFEENGFVSGEHVRAVAGTLLGCDGGSSLGAWTLKAILDNGDVIAASASVNMSSGDKKDDTFFGLYAPSGRYIKSVSWSDGAGKLVGLDGLAFITSKRDIVIAKTEIPKVEESTEVVADNGGSSSSGGNAAGSGALGLFGINVPVGQGAETTTNDYGDLFGVDRVGGSSTNSVSGTEESSSSSSAGGVSSLFSR